MPELCQNTGKIASGLIVYAPLDWGMGHTTRSIPIITTLQNLNYKVIIACKSSQKKILSAAFPDLVFKELRGYSITYGRSGWFTTLKIILQIPKILTNIKFEKRWIDQIVTETKPDFIISDNRYGFYNSQVKSILITHQLQIKTGLGKWIDKLVQKQLYKTLQHFSNCWVPDFEDSTINLAGVLSHPDNLCPIPVTYIGGLSRLRTCVNEKKNDTILCLLSGPEPQRTLLEMKILQEAPLIKRKIILVRGVTEQVPSISSSPNVTIFNYLDTIELSNYLCEAEFVICRAGYTSIMDFARIGCKALLIPTPGQAEQEYLAERSEEIRFAPFLKQKDFSIKAALQKMALFQYQQFEGDMEQYKKTIPAALEALKG